jgi:hypothetical protein
MRDSFLLTSLMVQNSLLKIAHPIICKSFMILYAVLL